MLISKELKVLVGIVDQANTVLVKELDLVDDIALDKLLQAVEFAVVDARQYISEDWRQAWRRPARPYCASAEDLA